MKLDQDNFVEVGFGNYLIDFSLEDDSNSWVICMIFKKMHEINLKLHVNWGSEEINKSIFEIENEILPSNDYMID